MPGRRKLSGEVFSFNSLNCSYAVFIVATRARPRPESDRAHLSAISSHPLFLLFFPVSLLFSQDRPEGLIEFRKLSQWSVQFRPPAILEHFCRAMLCISPPYAVVRWLSGWVSVTFVYCVETAIDTVTVR